MAYTPSTLQQITAGGINGKSGGIWTYLTTDAPATIDTANYISDGALRGMQLGDIVFAINTSTYTMQVMIVRSVTAGAGVDLNDGLAVAATNTD